MAEEYSHFESPRVPYYIKARIHELKVEGKDAAEIVELLKKEFQLIFKVDTVKSVMTDYEPHSYKDIPDEAWTWLRENHAYVKNGDIFINDGEPLKARLSVGLVKQTAVNGNLYVTKALIAVMEGKEIPEQFAIIQKDKDYRNTDISNLNITDSRNGSSTGRISMKDSETIIKCFAKHKGDALKTWVDLYDNHQISPSHNILWWLTKGKWKNEIASKYYTMNDIKNWNSSMKYAKFIDITPSADRSKGVEHVEEPQKEVQQAVKPVEEEKKIVTSAQPVITSTPKSTAPMALLNNADDLRYAELERLNLSKKKKLKYDDMKFVILYTSKKKVKSMNMFDVQKVLKENGFEFQIGLVKTVLNEILKGRV